MPLEDLVTPESLPNWDMAEVAAAFDGMGTFGNVRYMSPDWAAVLIGKHADQQPPSDDPMVIDEPTRMEINAVQLRYDEHSRRWRVHRIDLVGIPSDLLP